MKAGFNKDDLEEVKGFYDIDSVSVIEDVAKDFADNNHQIDEESDMKFTVYVEDNYCHIHEVKLFTECDPRFEVESIIKT